MCRLHSAQLECSFGRNGDNHMCIIYNVVVHQCHETIWIWNTPKFCGYTLILHEPNIWDWHCVARKLLTHTHPQSWLLSMQIWESILWVYLSLVVLAIHNYSFRAFHRDFDKPAQFTLINCVVVKMQNKWFSHCMETCAALMLLHKHVHQITSAAYLQTECKIYCLHSGLPLMGSEKYGKKENTFFYCFNGMHWRNVAQQVDATKARHKQLLRTTAARKSLNKYNKIIIN